LFLLEGFVSFTKLYGIGSNGIVPHAPGFQRSNINTDLLGYLALGEPAIFQQLKCQQVSVI
jgi:hypothetical protein